MSLARSATGLHPSCLDCRVKRSVHSCQCSPPKKRRLYLNGPLPLRSQIGTAILPSTELPEISAKDTASPTFIECCQAVLCHVLASTEKVFLARYVHACGGYRTMRETLLAEEDPVTGQIRSWRSDLKLPGRLEANLLHLYLLPSAPFWRVASVLAQYEVHMLEFSRRYPEPQLSNDDLFNAALLEELGPCMPKSHIQQTYKDALAMQRAVRTAAFEAKYSGPGRVYGTVRPKKGSLVDITTKARTRAFFLTVARMRMRLVYETKVHLLYGKPEMRQQLRREQYEIGAGRAQGKQHPAERTTSFTWRRSDDALEPLIIANTDRTGENRQMVKMLLQDLDSVGKNSVKNQRLMPRATYQLAAIRDTSRLLGYTEC